MAKLHCTNKLANLLCNITNELVGLWQDQRPTQHHDIANAQQVGQ
jgi:hypothetical protein